MESSFVQFDIVYGYSTSRNGNPEKSTYYTDDNTLVFPSGMIWGMPIEFTDRAKANIGKLPTTRDGEPIGNQSAVAFEDVIRLVSVVRAAPENIHPKED